MQKHSDLQVWRKGVDLVLEIYNITKQFPESERFGLSNQLRRCSVSVPSNTAEGHARKSDKDFLRFLRISYGSAAELETQLVISHRLGYIYQEEFDRLLTELAEIQKMLNKLMTTVAKS